MYNLIDIETKKNIKTNINLDSDEVNLLNYAYRLNKSKLKYVKAKKMKNTINDEPVELNLFKYQQPI